MHDISGIEPVEVNSISFRVLQKWRCTFLRSFWRNRNFIHHSHDMNSMKISFCNKCLSNRLLDPVESIHRFRAQSRSSCCQITCETRCEFAHQLFLLFPCIARDRHSIFWFTWHLVHSSLLFPHTKLSSEKTWIPASWMFDNPSSKRPIVSETLCILMIWEEMSICKKSPSASWLTRIPARRSPLPWVQVNSQFLKCFKIKKNQNAKFLGLIRHVRLRLGLC